MFSLTATLPYNNAEWKSRLIFDPVGLAHARKSLEGRLIWFAYIREKFRLLAINDTGHRKVCAI